LEIVPAEILQAAVQWLKCTIGGPGTACGLGAHH